MNNNRRDRLATERAGHYAPKPVGGMVMAGLTGAGVGAMADVIISGFYGWSPVDHPWFLAAVLICASVAGVVRHWRLARHHQRACGVELAKMEA